MAERAPFGAPIQQHWPVFALGDDECALQTAVEPGDIARFIGVRGVLGVRRLRFSAAGEQQYQAQADPTCVHDLRSLHFRPPRVRALFIEYSNESALHELSKVHDRCTGNARTAAARALRRRILTAVGSCQACSWRRAAELL